MRPPCEGCGNPDAYHSRGWIENGVYKEICDRCGGLASSDAPVHDVFWNGRSYYSEALQTEFTSRGQKARVMKEMGVSELGPQKLGEKNWIEGSRAYRRKQFDKDRPMIRETLKRYQERNRRER